MNADRKPMLFGCRINRPIGSAAEQHLTHGKQQHLHKTAIGRESLDLPQRQRRIMRGQKNRRPQARLAVEQFLRGPVVHGCAQRRRHVLVEQRDRAMQHIADG